MKTKNGTTYELKDSLTRGEFRSIQRQMLSGIDIDTVDTKSSVKADASQMLDNQETAIISTIVVSINDDTNVLNSYDNLPNKDAMEILEAANKVFNSETEAGKG